MNNLYLHAYLKNTCILTAFEVLLKVLYKQCWIKSICSKKYVLNSWNKPPPGHNTKPTTDAICHRWTKIHKLHQVNSFTHASTNGNYGQISHPPFPKITLPVPKRFTPPIIYLTLELQRENNLPVVMETLKPVDGTHHKWWITPFHATLIYI